MAVFNLGYFFSSLDFIISECNNFAYLRVEMLSLHYVNDLLMSLLMRCSFVPFTPFLLEGGLVVLVIKSLFGLSFFLPQVLFFFFKWSPFEISVFNRLSMILWISRGFKLSPWGDSNLFQTFSLRWRKKRKNFPVTNAL